MNSGDLVGKSGVCTLGAIPEAIEGAMVESHCKMHSYFGSPKPK